ncbi:hypothetical protein JJQ72_12500 [Paenibacillus sp. F411]|uniref:hypothetical protein n=1 Tax=Paenibacillus sp. F411 TaxID=2820239 RepID=UPI001AAEC5EB|nr:hypothetical protein [Paenibacillus sp. F411]MBO2944793.1 hypothetical protein [Paenibacillus sp. F411]
MTTSSPQPSTGTETEAPKHRLELLFERHAKTLALLLLAGLFIALLSFVLLKDITATVIAGSIMLLFLLLYLISSNLIAAHRANSWKDYVYSAKMASNLLFLLVLAGVCYWGRNDLLDIPHYYQKDFRVFTGVPQDIEYFHAASSKGPGSSTKFILESGEVLRYSGLIENLDPEHTYMIEYLPHSRSIVLLTDMDTGERWEMR